jgi:hypothetical protein
MSGSKQEENEEDRLQFLILTVHGHPMPRFINHPAPELRVDFSPFADVGCPPDEYGSMLCTEDSPLAAYNCDRIAAPDDLLGGLVPSHPLALCYFETSQHFSKDIETISKVETEGFIYRFGGLAPTYVRYILFVEEDFKVLMTAEDVKAAYAPIESPDEALSYALALNDLFASYGLKPESGMRYLASEIEDTHVDETDRCRHLFSQHLLAATAYTSDDLL